MLVNKDRVHSSEEPLKQLLKTKRMTPKRLRTFKGFDTISDCKAEKLIGELEELCKIMFNHIHRRT
ncbi:hypothetical protein [uncultured Aquimarina sp.]|uniref:hypothetical protein n=1 Tax=uncultured Aquimarina sp. TaxID=575652 RepID=UPI0026388147|nr:hypothetical protein [uncultured Aquimarina sp.]